MLWSSGASPRNGRFGGGAGANGSLTSASVRQAIQEIMSAAVHRSAGERGQVRAYPLRTRLPNMKPRADSAHRRNAIGCELASGHVGSLHLERDQIPRIQPTHPPAPDHRG